MLSEKGAYFQIQKNSIRTASLSQMLAFLVICTFLNMENISDLSTQYTLLKRYQDLDAFSG